jgi:hypothetical protein
MQLRVPPFARNLCFLAVALFAFPAAAKDEWAEQFFGFLKGFQTVHLLAISVVFLFIGIIAKFRQASGFVVLVSFLLCGLSAASFFVFALTGDLMNRKDPNRAFTQATLVEAQGPRPEPVKAANVGALCKRAGDCGVGTSCSLVAGAKRCWAPCGANNACDSGYVCMAPASGRSVCVKP